MKENSIEVKNDINKIANYYCDLFKNYSDLTSAQQEAVCDWAKRRFLGNGPLRFANAQFISKSAKEYIESLPIDQLDLTGFQMEHIVPKSNYGLEKIKNFVKDETLSESEKEGQIKKIVAEEMRVCFVTAKENEELNKISKNKMPEEFSEEKQNYFVRYEKAFNMNEEKLMKDFFIKIESIQIKDNKIIING